MKRNFLFTEVLTLPTLRSEGSRRDRGGEAGLEAALEKGIKIQPLSEAILQALQAHSQHGGTGATKWQVTFTCH